MSDPVQVRRQDALLVTDRAFMRPYDGSATIYTAWLAALRHLGFRVTVISFNQALVKWCDSDLQALGAKADSVLILDAYRSTVEAALVKVERIAAAVAIGRRYTSSLFGRRHAIDNVSRIRAFLSGRRFSVVVVNKTTSVRLLGPVLDRLTGYKLLDIHDNLPKRARLTRSAARRSVLFQPALARLMRIEDIGDVFGWASESRMMREELDQLRNFDGILFPDADEKASFTGAGLDPNLAHVVRWPILGPETVPSLHRPTRTGEFQIGFLGSAQLFNYEAVEFLVVKVMPYLRQTCPGIRVLIAGSIVPYAQRILRDAGVSQIPWIEQVADFYRKVDVVVVPLLSGTGVSVKTVEAAAHGSAIVSTPIGLRGLALRHEHEVLVASSAKDFAAAVGRLLNDPSLRRQLGTAATRAVAEHHSLSAFAQATKALLQDSAVACRDETVDVSDAYCNGI